MALTVTLAALALLSLALTLWQWFVARRFPLHQRVTGLPLTPSLSPSGGEGARRAGAQADSFTPPVALLKPLKGCDAETENCLRSWLAQDYAGPVQILFGVASPDDPVCDIVRRLIATRPAANAQLVLCGESHGANAKVSTLIQLERLAGHDVLIISDADVRVPPDFLTNVVAPLREARTGLVHCFYRLANPSTPAMRWEALCVNSDFWSQVLQARSLRPLDFALGAVMAVKRKALGQIGGFTALANYLADDYQLGHFIAAQGWRIELCPVVVDCWEAPMNWRRVWRHQLRWARTIRVCQPIPYFFSILSNATLWPALWLFYSGPFASPYNGPFASPEWLHVGEDGFVVVPKLSTALLVFCVGLMIRMLTATLLQARLTRTHVHSIWFWLVPVKDLLGVMIWALAFIGNTVEWRGLRYRVRPGGTLAEI